MEDPFPPTQDGEEKRTSLAFVDSSTSGAFFDNFDDEIEPLMSSTMSSLDTPPFGGALMACLPRLDCAKPYFDIDTSDVRGRMWSLMSPASLKALLKFDWARRDRAAVTVLALSSPLLAAIAARGPDAWGPLWIALTAVFTIGAASNIVGWDIASNGVGVLSKTPVLAGWNIGVNGGPGGVATKPPVNFIKEEVYNGDLTKLTGALTLVAFFAMATPLLLAGLARLWKITHVRSAADAEFDVEGGAKESGATSMTLMVLVCLYGYSFVFLVFGCLFALVPIRGACSISLGIACLLATASISKELWPVVTAHTGSSAAPRGKAPFFAAALATSNAVLYLTVKLFYFA
tara:strand:+ start:3348 stop:4385 length:1038 start_codon:yes stop_codon:yes gene_type:complete